MSEIRGLVRSATVAVVHEPPGEPERVRGSGFFVAPGVVLTCAHVVLDARGPLGVRWNGRTYAVLRTTADPDHREDGGSLPAPDTAVLEVDLPADHPCVPLTDGTDPATGDLLLTMGYTKVRVGEMEPDSARTQYVDRTGWPGGELYKLAGGQIAPGISGGPVLDLRRRGVCAMAKSTLDEDTDLGGHAVPIDDALDVGDGTALRRANAEGFGKGLAALRRSQAGLGLLPSQVVLQLGPAAPMLVGLLAQCSVDRPIEVADADVAEWAVRQLFVRDVGDLIGLLERIAPLVPDAALDIAEAVVCCVPPGEDPAAGWVSGDAAEALRLEWTRSTPRVVRVPSSCAATVRLVLRRALHRTVPSELKPLPFSAEVAPNDPDGVPVQLRQEIVGWLHRELNTNPDLWANQEGKLVGRAREQDHVACLHPSVLDCDAGLLAALMKAFSGLRFLVFSRTDAVPSNAAQVLLDLQPPVDALDEDYVLGWLTGFDKRYPGGIPSSYPDPGLRKR